MARLSGRDWTYTGEADVDEIVIAVDGTTGVTTITPAVGTGKLSDGERLFTDLAWEGITFHVNGAAGLSPLLLVGVDSEGKEVLRVDVAAEESFRFPEYVYVADSPSTAAGHQSGLFFGVVTPGIHTLSISADNGLEGLEISVTAAQFYPHEFELVLDEASCTSGPNSAATGTLTNMTDDAHSYRLFIQFGPLGEHENQVAIVEDLQPGSTVQWTSHRPDLSGYDLCQIDIMEIDDFLPERCGYHIDWCPQPKPAH